MKIYKVEVFDAFSDRIQVLDLDADGMVAELESVIERGFVSDGFHDSYLKYFTTKDEAEACSRSVRKELEEQWPC
tara:strand:- start:616 stop:840 length:225 start_codon:yes stop_codon:yes gene_type:complete